MSLLALAAALERVHVHAQRERLPGQHRPVQPPHARATSGRRHDDRLLGVAVDVREMRVALEVEARARDRVPQPQAGLDRLLALDWRVELAEQLAGRRRAGSPVCPGRVEARPQQRDDLLAVQELGRHPLRLELGAQRVDAAEVLAHRPPMRGQRALERSRRQLPPAPVRERGPRDVLARKQRHHQVVIDLDRGLAVGVQPQRLLKRGVQPPARQRQPIASTALAARRWPRTRLDLPPAFPDELAEVHRVALDNELDPLLVVELGDQPLERVGRLHAFLAGHQQRIHRAHAEDPHERPLARDHQAGAIDRLHAEQLTRLP